MAVPRGITIFIILIGLKTFGCELTEKKNQERLGSCGDAGAAGLWMARIYGQEDVDAVRSVTSNWTTSSFTSPLNPLFPDDEEAIGVFITQNHVLTTSNPFVYRNVKDQKWYWKAGKKAVKWKDCDWRYGQPFVLKLPSSAPQYVVRDARNQERRLEMIYLLDFCDHQTDADEFLTILVLKEEALNPVHLVCLPKMRTRVHLEERLELYEPEKEPRRPKVVTCDDWKRAGFCTTTQIACKQGAALVQRDRKEVDILVGIGARRRSDGRKTCGKWHEINYYTQELCEKFRICRRCSFLNDAPPMQTIKLIPNSNDGKVYAEAYDDYFEMQAAPRAVRWNGKHGNNGKIVACIFSLLFLF